MELRRLTVPFMVLLYSVIAFIVIPLAVGMSLRIWLTRTRGKNWFERGVSSEVQPGYDPRPAGHIWYSSLLSSLKTSRARYFHVVLIAIPILIQVYFNSTLDVWIDELLQSRAFGSRAGRVDRRKQFLRAGGGDSDCSFRPWLGRGAGYGGGSAGRSAGDAFGLQRLQSYSTLVSGPTGRGSLGAGWVEGGFVHCYECLQAGEIRDAVGLCHHCAAALCAEHICVVDDPVTGGVPLVRTVVLPKKARLLLCGTCKAALEQPRSGHAEYVGIEH